MGSLLHVLGIDTTMGPWYAFWSGAGSDLAYLGIFLAVWRHANCHEAKCLRIGHLPVEGTTFKVCRRHHPAPPQRGDIRRRYHLYAGDRPGKG